MGIFAAPLPEAISFTEQLDEALRRLPEGKGLSRLQRHWIAFCITAIVVTHAICWERFERGSAGYYRAKALSFMLHWSPIPWKKLLMASTLLLFRLHGITSGILAIDDDNRPRSKSTKRLFGVHKVIDKKTNGFVMAQNLVKLVLVTRTITLPVGIEFYMPDPAFKAWLENDKELKAKGVAKPRRPAMPKPRKDFPSKQKIATILLRRFKWMASWMTVKAIVADAAYLSPFLRAECARIYPQAQLISQLRNNQLVWAGRGQPKALKEYFKGLPARRIKLMRRGSDEVEVIMASARLHVKSHKGRTMLIVAVKYKDDEEYRFLAAIDPTWRSLDVVKAYAFRWLVEVVIEDWKLYEGFGKMACQQREEGARRSLCLSMLVDHFLLQTPEQLRLARAGQPLHTVGTLMNQLQVSCLLKTVEGILASPDPTAALQELAQQLREVVVLRPSDKHMSGKEFADLGPSPSLSRRFGKGP